MHFVDLIRNNQCFNLFFALVPTVLIIGFFLLGFLIKNPIFRKVLRFILLSLCLLPIILIDLLLLINEKILISVIFTAPFLIIGVLIYIFRQKGRVKAILAVVCALIIFLFSWSVIDYTFTISAKAGKRGIISGCTDIVSYFKDYQIKPRMELFLIGKEEYCDKQQEEALKGLEEFKNGFCEAHYDDLRSRDCKFYSDDCYRFSDGSISIMSKARRFCPQIFWRLGPDYSKEGFYCKCINNKCVNIK